MSRKAKFRGRLFPTLVAMKIIGSNRWVKRWIYLKSIVCGDQFTLETEKLCSPLQIKFYFCDPIFFHFFWWNFYQNYFQTTTAIFRPLISNKKLKNNSRISILPAVHNKNVPSQGEIRSLIIQKNSYWLEFKILLEKNFEFKLAIDSFKPETKNVWELRKAAFLVESDHSVQR